jgi:hypothetical protein
VAVIDHFGVNCSEFGKLNEFYDKALGALGRDRIWIRAFVRDPDGNNVEAVFHGA